MILKRGVYYIKGRDVLCTFSNVKQYKDHRSHFYILTWHDEKGTFKKTMIKQSQSKGFIYVGML